MPINPVDPRPPSQQIADDLRAEIEAGRIPSGGRLPSTSELAARYGVTRETIRQAIARLKSAGIVSSRQGSGVFARPRPAMKRLGINRYAKSLWRDTGIVAFAADREASSRTWSPGDQTQTVSEVAADPQVAEAFGVEPGTRMYERARLVAEQGVPTHTLTSYYRPSDVEGTRLVDAAPGPAGHGGGFAVLTEQGLEPHEVQEDLTARMPTPQEVQTLRLPPGEPIVELHRTTYTADGRVIEFARGVHSASRFTWSYRFKIPE